ncbi:NnrS family protein [Marinobacter sp. ATCH36]|uniref:NnrS family protein n=1 Tax=Marinobacter sp. ATCH36 TaxID=2945106 RepID=UPI00202271ED|nr:NnrS family protein [Marinobacter sp. ATCH36]MCL7943486.1 NnrS family protein [Marinobacter sp. ATCH36]
MTSDNPARPRKNIHSFWLFFPAASLLAALAVPLSIYSTLSGAGHGHELIFGFGLALIAGYTLGPQPWRVLAPLFLLWLVARLGWAWAPDNLVPQLLSPAFLLSVAYWLVAGAPASISLTTPDTRRIMIAAIIGLLLLMTFMGSRIIAPGTACH